VKELNLFDLFHVLELHGSRFSMLEQLGLIPAPAPAG
jgi:hypothetical protein